MDWHKRLRSWSAPGALVVAAIVAVAAVAWWPQSSERDAKVLVQADDAAGGTWGSEGDGEHPDARAVLQRTTDDGTRVTVVKLVWPAQGDPYGDAGAGWVPPPQCRPTGDLEIGLGGTKQTAMGWASAFADVPNGAVVRGGGVTGHPALGPILFAAVQVGDDVDRVRLVLAGDVVDGTAPTNGWAVVAVELPRRDRPDDLTIPDGHLEIVGAGATRELPVTPEEMDRPECQPPPPTIPSDARPAGDGDASAVEEIQQAFRAVFSGGNGPEEWPVLVSNGDQLDDELIERIRKLGENYKETDIQLEFRETGFVDDATALIVFRLRNLVDWKVGQADLVDGHWLVSSQTFCHMIAMSSITCPETIWDGSRGANGFTS
jgi:hypothetical protein